jgi:hypothetical protein
MLSKHIQSIHKQRKYYTNNEYKNCLGKNYTHKTITITYQLTDFRLNKFLLTEAGNN